MKKPYIIYLRKSTAKQCLDTQRESTVRYAKERGFDYLVFEEEMSSRKSRPIKQHILQLLRSGEYGGLIVQRLDRYARSLREIITEVFELSSKGIDFISIKENLDFSTPMGRMQIATISVFAEFERDLIRSRIKDSLKQKKESGQKLGRPVGAKDKAPRKKLGYYIREEIKRANKHTPNNEGIEKALNNQNGEG